MKLPVSPFQTYEFGKKTLFADKSKIASFCYFISITSRFAHYLDLVVRPTFRYQDSIPFSEVTTRWLATVVIVLLVVSWIGLATWRRVKKLEALKLDVNWL